MVKLFCLLRPRARRAVTIPLGKSLRPDAEKSTQSLVSEDRHDEMKAEKRFPFLCPLFTFWLGAPQNPLTFPAYMVDGAGVIGKPTEGVFRFLASETHLDGCGGQRNSWPTIKQLATKL